MFPFQSLVHRIAAPEFRKDTVFRGVSLCCLEFTFRTSMLMKQVYLADGDQSVEALLLCQLLARTIASPDFEARFLASFHIWLLFVPAVEVGEAEATSQMDSSFLFCRFRRSRIVRLYPRQLATFAASLF